MARRKRKNNTLQHGLGGTEVNRQPLIEIVKFVMFISLQGLSPRNCVELQSRPSASQNNNDNNNQQHRFDGKKNRNNNTSTNDGDASEKQMRARYNFVLFERVPILRGRTGRGVRRRGPLVAQRESRPRMCAENRRRDGLDRAAAANGLRAEGRTPATVRTRRLRPKPRRRPALRRDPCAQVRGAAAATAAPVEHVGRRCGTTASDVAFRSSR